MPRRYETPNHGLSNEGQTPQEDVIRRLEAAERGLDPLPPGTVAEESGELQNDVNTIQFSFQ
jgi:hypothetical protein